MKRKGRVAIDEDAYVEGLAAVIQRDYFPELSELRDTAEYLEADRREDFSKKQELLARRARREAAADAVAEAGLGAEMSSVDSFLSHFTSEDNASFGALQEEELAARRAADAWGQRREAWLQQEREKKILMLENNNGGSTGKRSLAALEQGDPVMLLEGSNDKQVQVYENQLARAAKERGEKVIDRDNTRLSAEAIRRLNTVAAPVDPSGKRKKLSALVQQNRLLGPKGRAVGGTIDLDDLFDKPTNEDALESEPTIRGYTFVETPKIVPGQGLTGASESPIVSWGAVGGTPIVLHTGPQFTIPEEPERDRAAQKLAERKLKRHAPAAPAATSSSRLGTPLLGASPVFSPAGQKLLEARLKSKGTTPLIFKSPATTSGGGGSSSMAKFQSPARKM